MNTIETFLDDGRTVTILLTEPFVAVINKLRDLKADHKKFIKNMEDTYPGLVVDESNFIDYLWQSGGITFNGFDKNYDLTLIIMDHCWKIGAYNYITNIQHISEIIQYSDLVQK